MKDTIADLSLFRTTEKINVNEVKSLRNWADKLGTTPARLKSAINMVGDSAKKFKTI